jgi:dethiobiotin synthetase
VTGYFVTGTDTGVGKTFVTCALARVAITRGKKVFAFKPIETGGIEDGEALATAAGDWQADELRGLYRFERPAAPVVAATRPIDVLEIVATTKRGAAGCDLVLVEGAGGWRVPLTESQDTSALARHIGLPVLIIARATLGTINHSLLTVEAVQRDKLPVAGLILSRRPDDSLDFARENQREIQRRTNVRVELSDDLTSFST